MNKQTENTIEQRERMKAFAEWCSGNDWFYNFIEKTWFNEWHGRVIESTTDELLDLFYKENK